MFALTGSGESPTILAGTPLMPRTGCKGGAAGYVGGWASDVESLGPGEVRKDREDETGERVGRGEIAP